MKHLFISTIATIACAFAVIFCYPGENKSADVKSAVIEKQYSPVAMDVDVLIKHLPRTAMDVDVLIKHLPRTAMDVEILVKHPHFSAFDSEAFPISHSVNA